MRQNPSVSVVIPVYARREVLRDAIESLFSQDYGPLEIIVVDDGTPEDLEKYLSPYLSRIKYIKREENGGVSAARNSGIKAAQGEYVAFLDSDDLFLRDKLSRQIESMVSKNLFLSHSGEFWYRNGRWLNQGPRHLRYGGDIFCRVLDKCRVSPSSLVVKKDVFKEIGMFDESLRVCEDYEFVLRASFLYPFDYLERKLIIKRSVTEDSLSASIKHIESLRLDILEKFAAGHKEISEERKAALENELARKRWIVSRGKAKNKILPL